MISNADELLQLGRDLADALDPSDVIGRWMSHHLAELISRCEQDPDDQELAKSTRDVVLKLWEHKAGAPLQTKPFTHLEPVLRAIERLDPNPDPWAFYKPFDAEVPSAGALSAYPLLAIACDVDQQAGHIIRLSAGIAAKQAITCEEPWVLMGKKMAKTEEDRAVRALEDVVRRLRMQPGISRDNSTTAEEHQDDEFHQTSRSAFASAATSDDRSGVDQPITEGSVDDRAEPLDSLDPLILALQSSIDKCRSLIDRLAEIAKATVIEGEVPERG